MKKRAFFYSGLLLFFLLVGFATRNPVFTSRKIQFDIPKADPETLKLHVEILSATNPPRNFSHPESLDQVADYIAKNFRQSGLIVHMQEFTVGGKVFQNVVAHLGPTQGEALVIGAHYDVCEDLPGADDNASGTAGLIELARILSPLQSKLNRPIKLVAYTLEEPPNFRSKTMGSFVHAASLKKQNIKIKLMMSLEMLGYFSDESGSQAYPARAFHLFYPSVGNYIALIARPNEWFVTREVKSIFIAATDLPVISANVPRFVPGVDFSDHFNYWDQGFPAMMITDTAFMRNPNYHLAGDLPQKLNFSKMAEVINGIAAIAVNF